MPETSSGLVVVDKAGGMTSHDVVARVRRLAGTRKVGHAGTLDPMATGVLVLGLNRATRLLGHLTLTDKRYAATIRLGVSTTTDDAAGEVTATASTDALTGEAVRKALASFVGELDQVPSAVSAIKVAGKRAYARVRDGEVVELPARRVTVHSLDVVSTSLDHGQGSADRREGDPAEVEIEVHCSSGTYIRAIARDLGEALGVGGHLTALRRTAVGPFGIHSAHTLDELEESFAMTPISEAVRAWFPVHELDDAGASAVRVGRSLDLPLDVLTGLFAPDGTFLALYEPSGDTARPVAVFV